jgi:dTDP-4-amino-4,6-dideoxygalactose transaminase
MHRTSEIAFNAPSLMGREMELLQEAINRNRLAGDGHFTRLCHDWLRQELGSEKVLLTTSCTAALEMSALLLDIEPGDEVIVPSFTFVSGANAFALRNAKPVFVDIRRDTLNIDETLVESRISSKTKAITFVNYAGVGCEMDPLLAIAKRHQIALIEDNAHGLFGKYQGRPLGSFGTFATQSFHDTKNVTCGEGGALIINDAQFAERAEILWEKGTNRKKFLSGLVDKYTWVDIGSSFLPSDLLAAFLFGQLEKATRIQELRHAVWQHYFDTLQPIAPELGISLPQIPPGCDHAAHLFYILLPSQTTRDKLIDLLRSRNIGSAFHYLPLHLSPMGRRFGYREGDCPITEEISGRLLRLPFHNRLTKEEQNCVVSAIKDFCSK